MKTSYSIHLILSIIIVSINSIGANAQNDIKGDWSGILQTPFQKLRLNFNIQSSPIGFKSVMDSPDQGAMDILVNHTVFNGDTIRMSISDLRMSYVGVLQGDSIVNGEFKQSGMTFPLKLRKGYVKLNRPQTPVPPFSYKVEEVKFHNKQAGIELVGTLTFPNNVKQAPAVVLISGSGLQDRDESIFGHKPFAVIADYLTNRGIAVLRFDDRSVGKSGGDATNATTVDFATDVTAAVNYLQHRKEINKKQIGLIGHSEGGLIAPMVAAQEKRIAFVILMAAPGVPGDKLLLEQQQLMGRAGGMSEKQLDAMRYNNEKIFDILKVTSSIEQAEDSVWGYIEASDLAHDTNFNRVAFGKQLDQLTTPWMMYFLNYDPAETLIKVKCPTLILNGLRDLQVSAKQNVPPIELSLKLGGNKAVTTHEYKNVNHLFQECRTGSIGEYSIIEQTISPEVLQDIQKWIADVVSK
ncbi:MAG: alpha/beta hydrolase family protein [Mangrovibacterium sp.]